MKLNNLKTYIRLVAILLLFLIYSAGMLYVGRQLEHGIKKKDSNSELKNGTDALKRPLPVEEVQSAKVLAGNIKLCANTEYSFEVSYPNDWFSSYNDKADECSFFAPYSFVVPAVPEEYFTPITIKVIPSEEWESTINSLKIPSELYSVISFKNLEINSRPVKYVESVSTGHSQQKGFIKISYLVFHSKTPLEITYFQNSTDEDLASNRKKLDEMVNSLKFY